MQPNVNNASKHTNLIHRIISMETSYAVQIKSPASEDLFT